MSIHQNNTIIVLLVQYKVYNTPLQRLVLGPFSVIQASSVPQ